MFEKSYERSGRYDYTVVWKGKDDEPALPRVEQNTAQLMTLFALPNLWMVRSKLLGAKA